MEKDIDREKIERLVRLYLTGNKSVYEELRNALSLFIYSYPVRRFHAEPEICGDFYLFIDKKFRRIIESFDITKGVPFIAFFSLILAKEYKIFVSLNSDFNKNILSIEREKYKESNISFKERLVAYKSRKEKDSTELMIFYEFLNTLSVKKRLILKLYFGMVLLDDELEYLIKIVGRDEMNKFLLKAAEKNAKRREIRLLYEKRLIKLYNKLIKRERDSRYLKNSDEIEKLEKRRKRLIELYYYSGPAVGLETVALLLRSSRSAVHRTLEKIKEELREWIK